MKIKLVTTAALLLASSLVLAGPERRTSLDEAVSEARERYNGRVLSAETRRRNGHETHNIRILTRDGQVRRYRVDADRMPPRGQPQRRHPPPRDFRR